MPGVQHLDGQALDPFDACIHLSGIIDEFPLYRLAISCGEQISAEELTFGGQDAYGPK